MAERTIILDGFSKTYAMTGWRLGYGVMPEWLAEQVSRLMVNSVSCTASLVQRAGLEALTGPQDAVRDMVAAFRRRRDLMVDGLNEIPGISCLTPGRRVLRLPEHQRHRRDAARSSPTTCWTNFGVAAIAGTAFGDHGEGYLRLSYANSEENLDTSPGAH